MKTYHNFNLNRRVFVMRVDTFQKGDKTIMKELPPVKLYTLPLKFLLNSY